MVGKQLFFPGLNGVRFIAALLVIVAHVELLKLDFGWTALISRSTGMHIGNYGVSVFFVLSGFLITSLLMMEKKVGGKINIRHFYIRRVLRIWPLYFLVFLISLFLVPYIPLLDTPDGFWTKDNEQLPLTIICYIFLLANVAFVYLPKLPFAHILWSVAVEEQFYLVWPLLVRYVKRIAIALIVLLGLMFALKFVTAFSSEIFGISRVSADKLMSLYNKTRFSCMVIGGLGAYVLAKDQKRILDLIYHPVVQVAALTYLALDLTDVIRYGILHWIRIELFSVCTMIVLLNISSNNRSLVKLESGPFDLLGKISYGLYVYHLFVIVLMYNLIGMLGLDELAGMPVFTPLLLLLALFLTVAVASLSYRYFERPVLKRKSAFTVIRSGDEVKH